MLLLIILWRNYAALFLRWDFVLSVYAPLQGGCAVQLKAEGSVGVPWSTIDEHQPFEASALCRLW